MIVAMAGLPGVGKSTLARALATRLDAVVLDKDRVRAGLFSPPHLEYSRDQDDFCLDVMYRAAGWLVHRRPGAVVILDGCTYTRTYRVARLRTVAADLGEAVRVIECTCADATAMARIEADQAAGRHLAANRDAELHRRVRAGAEPIPEPKLVVDTGRCVEACVADCLRYLAVPLAGN